MIGANRYTRGAAVNVAVPGTEATRPGKVRRELTEEAPAHLRYPKQLQYLGSLGPDQNVALCRTRFRKKRNVYDLVGVAYNLARAHVMM